MSSGKQRPSAPWSQGHYWGQYDNPMSLPNMAGAPIQEESVQAGDVAWSVSDSSLYVCTDPARGAAVWAALASGGSLNTRDAHQIVVGSEANGDIAGVDADIVDPGDGSGIAQALSDAAALNRPVDVRLRPMDVTLDSSTAPLEVPRAVRLVGATGSLNAASVINGRDSGDQTVIRMLLDTELVDVRINSPAPVETITSPEAGVIEVTESQTRIERVTLDVETSTEPRAQRFGIRFADDTEQHRVVDCRLTGGTQQDGSPTVGVFAAGETRIHGCNVTGWDTPIFSSVSDIQITETKVSGNFGAVLLSIDSPGDRAALISDCWITPTEDAGSCIEVRNVGDSAVRGALISNCFLEADGITRGIRLSGGAQDLTHTIVRGCAIIGPDTGVEIVDAAVVNAIIGFNNLTDVTTPIDDNGTGTEVAHNVP